MDAFVLLLGMVSPHGPPFSKIVQSTSDGIDGPWMTGGSPHLERSPHPDFDMGMGGECGYHSGIYATFKGLDTEEC